MKWQKEWLSMILISSCLLGIKDGEKVEALILARSTTMDDLISSM
jgi:hypothetical protein